MTNGADEPILIEDKDLAESTRRFQQQCVLSYYLPIFAYINQDRVYSNFAQVNGLNPAQIVSKLTAIPDAMELMYIKPMLLTSLMPRLRLFKVFPDELDEKSGRPKEVELHFDDYLNITDSFKYRDVGGGEVMEEIFSGRAGRGAGIGLKEFSWVLNGSQPAEVDHIINANITFHFQTLHDLTKIQNSNTNSDNPVAFIDLINQQMSADEECRAGGISSKYYRIKAVVGWSKPRGDIWETPEAQGLAEAVDKAVTSLYLSLQTHDLDFRQDGTLELSLTYSAVNEAIMSDPDADVFKLGDTGGLLANLADLKEQEEDATELIGDIADDECLRGDSKQAKKDTKEANAKLEEIEELRKEDLTQIYQQILNALISDDRVFYVDVDQELIGQISKKEQAIDSDAAELRTSSGSSQAALADLMYQLNAGQIAKFSGVKDVQKGIDKAKGDEEDISDLTNEISTSQRGVDKDHVRINYFFFGDLLDKAFSVLDIEGSNKALKDLRCIVGSLNYTEVGALAAYKKATAIQTTMNIADIPISLDSFLVWFLNVVVKPQRTTYSLRMFIKDAINTLIGNALSPKCFGNLVSTPDIRVSESLFDAPLNADGTDRITGTNVGSAFGNVRTKIDDIASFPTSGDAQEREQGNYYLLYVSNQSFNNLDANTEDAEERDSKNGIYWFRIGSDRGIVKKVKFSRINQPFLRETLIQQETNKAAACHGALLQDIYNAQIDLFGNALFKPGMLCYVDPKVVGAGDAAASRAAAQALNFGGYYRVITVDNVIRSGTFDTELELVWEAWGDPLLDTARMAEELGACPKSTNGVAFPGDGQTPDSTDVTSTLGIIED